MGGHSSTNKRPAVLLLATLLSYGCGGSSGGGGSTPQPGQPTVIVLWSGITHSMSPQGIEPIELGVVGTPGSIQGSDGRATHAQVQVYIRPSSAGPATLAVADTTIATLDVNDVLHSSTSPGTTVIRARVPSGVESDMPVLVYPRMALACAPVQPPDSAPAYAFRSGQPVAVSSISQADIYLQGPSCPGAFHYNTPLVTVARQISLIPKSEPFAIVAPGPPTSARTWGFDIFTSQALLTAGFAFATASTRNVKFMVTQFCQGTGKTPCGNHEYLEGLYLISDTNGNWAY